MPNKRYQVNPLPGPQPIQPQANPVSTFHQALIAPPEQGNSALDLAAALASFHKPLERYTDLRIGQEQEEGAKAFALQAAREQNRQGFKEAVDAGQIPLGLSPWARKGYYRASQRVAAEQLADDLQQAYAKSATRNSNNPADVTKFIQEHTAEYVKLRGLDQQPEFNSVFLPMADQIHAGIMAKHGQEQVAKIEQGMQEKLYQETQLSLDRAKYSPGPGIDPLRIIEATIQDNIRNGMDGTVANKLAVDAIADYAVKENDLDALDALDELNTGNGTLGKTKYAQEQRAVAETKIINEKWTNFNHQKQLEKFTQDKLSSEIHSEMASRLSQNPAAPIDDLIQKMASVDSNQVSNMLSTQQAFLNRTVKVYEDPEIIGSIYEELYNGTLTPAKITEHAAAGEIDPGTVGTLNKELAIYNSHSQDLLSENYKNARSMLLRNFGSDFMGFERAESANRAETELKRSFLRWKSSEEGQRADAIQETDWLEKRRTQIESLYVESDPFSTKAGLQEAIDEYNQNQGQGILADAAAEANMSVDAFIRLKKKTAK